MSDLLKRNYKIDMHTHTVASGHAYNTIDEMVAYAKEVGMTHLGITDHAPLMPGTAHEFYFQNLKVVDRDYDGLRLLLGAELNICDENGNVDLSQNLISNLDITIASIHPPCIETLTKAGYTKAFINAMNNPYINVIGHPDDSRIPVDYVELVKAAKETNTLIEINNNSLRPTGPRVGARDNDRKLLELAAQMGVHVILGSDAHYKNDIGNFNCIEDLLFEVHFPKELIVNRDFDALVEFLPNYRKKYY